MPTNKRIFTVAIVGLAVLGGGGAWFVVRQHSSPESHLKRADEYFAQGQFDEARLYHNVLKKGGANPRAIQKIGETWSKQGVHVAALGYLSKAVELMPDDLELRMKVADASFALGQFGEVNKVTRAILDRNPAHKKAIALLAETSFGEQLEEVEERLSKLEPTKSVHYHLASGMVARRRGDIPSFKAALDKALELGPEVVEAHSLQAVYCALSEDKEGHGEALKTASELADPGSGVHLSYARFLVEQGLMKEAKSVLNDVITQTSAEYFPAVIRLADIYRHEKRYDEALKMLHRVLTTFPLNPEAAQIKAQVLLDQGSNPAEAAEELEALEDLDLPLVKFQLARLYLADNKIQEARAKLVEVTGSHPYYAAPVVLLAEIDINSGDVTRAISGLEVLLEEQPDQVNAQLMLGSAYEAAGRFDAAEQIVQKQINASPEDANLHFALTRLLRKQDKPQEARLSLLNAEKLGLDPFLVTTQFVEMDLAKGDFESALENVSSRIGGTANGHLLAGRIHMARRNLDKAEAEFRKAVNLDPARSNAFALLITVYAQQNKLAEATKEVEALLARSPDDVTGLTLYGNVLSQGGDYEKALEIFEKLIVLQPDSDQTLNNLAYLYASQHGDLERALELAERAYTLSPNNPSYADTLGWILFKQGKYGDALPLLQPGEPRKPKARRARLEIPRRCSSTLGKRTIRSAKANRHTRR